MPLSNEKIAELQTLAEILGIKPTPGAAYITKLYDDYLTRLNTPNEPDDPQAEADRARSMAMRLDRFKKGNS